MSDAIFTPPLQSAAEQPSPVTGPSVLGCLKRADRVLLVILAGLLAQAVLG
ncbi:MAG: hypothetical protein RLO05_06230 [Rhodospirillales bacterium]